MEESKQQKDQVPPMAAEDVEAIRALKVEAAARGLPALRAWHPRGGDAQELGAGVRVCILGRTCCGKTTALRELAMAIAAHETPLEQTSPQPASAAAEEAAPQEATGIEAVIAFSHHGQCCGALGGPRLDDSGTILPPHVVHDGRWDEALFRAFVTAQRKRLAAGHVRPSLALFDETFAKLPSRDVEAALQDAAASASEMRCSIVTSARCLPAVPRPLRSTVDFLVCFDASREHLNALFRRYARHIFVSFDEFDQVWELKASLGAFWALVLDVRNQGQYTRAENRAFWYKAAFP